MTPIQWLRFLIAVWPILKDLKQRWAKASPGRRLFILKSIKKACDEGDRGYTADEEDILNRPSGAV